MEFANLSSKNSFGVLILPQQSSVCLLVLYHKVIKSCEPARSETDVF